MAIGVGDRVPEVGLQTWRDGRVGKVTTAELFGGKLVVLFGVPGAFTPTCSDTHLPGFLLRSDELRRRGVDLLACVAVNDAFVMGAWARERQVGEAILMLADGNGNLARALALELDASGFGMGRRCRRFAAILEDGVVRYLGVEPGAEVGVSGAEAVLAAL